MTDTPADHNNEMVIALTPQQLGAIVAIIVALVLIRRARKHRATV